MPEAALAEAMVGTCDCGNINVRLGVCFNDNKKHCRQCCTSPGTWKPPDPVVEKSTTKRTHADRIKGEIDSGVETNQDCPHELCEYVADSSRDFESHQKVVHENAVKEKEWLNRQWASKEPTRSRWARRKCGYPGCRYWSFTSTKMAVHRKKHPEGEGNMQESCDQCDFRGHSRRSLGQHKRQKHPDAERRSVHPPKKKKHESVLAKTIDELQDRIKAHEDAIAACRRVIGDLQTIMNMEDPA